MLWDKWQKNEANWCNKWIIYDDSYTPFITTWKWLHYYVYKSTDYFNKITSEQSYEIFDIHYWLIKNSSYIDQNDSNNYITYRPSWHCFINTRYNMNMVLVTYMYGTLLTHITVVSDISKLYFCVVYMQKTVCLFS